MLMHNLGVFGGSFSRLQTGVDMDSQFCGDGKLKSTASSECQQRRQVNTLHSGANSGKHEHHFMNALLWTLDASVHNTSLLAIHMVLAVNLQHMLLILPWKESKVYVHPSHASGHSSECGSQTPSTTNHMRAPSHQQSH